MPARAKVLAVSTDDVAYLDSVFLEDGKRLRLLPAAAFRAYPTDHVSMWCQRTARYGLPTVELVEWLRQRIAGRKAIEVGAGKGDLGRLLGIPMSDSHVQMRPEIEALYRMQGAEIVVPPIDVERAEALQAIKRHRPDVVIASWLTQLALYDGEDGFAFGAHERNIIKRAGYIFIGNRGVHQAKRIFRLPHVEHAPPWLVSRAFDQSVNRIWEWERQK